MKAEQSLPIMKAISIAQDVKRNNGYNTITSPRMGPTESVFITGLSLHSQSFI